jgi:myosin heavy subunit
VGLFERAKYAGKRAVETVSAVGKADPQVISLVHERLTEQDRWNDVFSTKLIELLDKNDQIRSEIRARLEQLSSGYRAQQELLRAAEEHRRLSAEYQETTSALAAAQEGFSNAQKILVEASELRERSAAYELAERQLVEANCALQKTSAALDEAKAKFQEARQAAAEVVSGASSFAARAERAANNAESKSVLAQQRLDAAHSDLGRATLIATAAAAKYDEATHATESATAASTDASSKLRDAQNLLDEATRKFVESAKAQTSSAGCLRRGEVLANVSEQKLNDAIQEKHGAEASLLKAGHRLHIAALYSLASFLAAASICIWGAFHGIAVSRFGAFASAAMVVVSGFLGIILWTGSK